MMHEYYARLFEFAPAILSEAMHQSASYDRFKITVKFAFSILQSMLEHNDINVKPMMPKFGETF